ncbi:DUF2690 domain-containing protein [Kitasatospora sp. NPDC057500]|uniref:DUF2690 domain-containing protein n=1 Tax=Kitasatospora sp. NPDC057500 TaxID=3346151 RepID=UPI003696254F
MKHTRTKPTATSSNTRRRTAASALAALACTIGLTLHGAPAAQAANAYDGKDPQTTGCSNNSTTLSSAPLKTSTGHQVGTIEMRYSYTCKTQWIRIHSTVTDCSGQPCGNDARIHRTSATSDGGTNWFGRSPDVASGEPYQWSRMVYTPNTRACGTGWADTGVSYAHPNGRAGTEICG